MSRLAAHTWRVKAGIVGQAEAAMRVEWPLTHGGKAIIVGSGRSHRQFTSK